MDDGWQDGSHDWCDERRRRERARGRVRYPRCWGISSDALAGHGAGGPPPSSRQRPVDLYDLAACYRTWRMAPDAAQARMRPVLDGWRAEIASHRRPEELDELDSVLAAEAEGSGPRAPAERSVMVLPDGRTIDDVLTDLSFVRERHPGVRLMVRGGAGGGVEVYHLDAGGRDQVEPSPHLKAEASPGSIR